MGVRRPQTVPCRPCLAGRAGRRRPGDALGGSKVCLREEFHERTGIHQDKGKGMRNARDSALVQEEVDDRQRLARWPTSGLGSTSAYHVISLNAPETAQPDPWRLSVAIP